VQWGARMRSKLGKLDKCRMTSNMGQGVFRVTRGWEVVVQLYSKGANGQMCKVDFTHKPLGKGENTKGTIYSNPLPPTPNTRWINYIEFGKEKTMLSSSMRLGK
jgi:hypothetical protein